MSEQLASDDEIRTVLESGLSRQMGGDTRIAFLGRRAYEFASSCTVEVLDVELQDERQLTVIFKNLSPAALLMDARRVRPSFLYDPLREIRLYEHVLSKVDLGAANCFATHVDESAGQFWLFLEKVKGRELYRVGEFALWEEAARWLARFHGMIHDIAVEMSDLRLLRWDKLQFVHCMDWARNSLKSKYDGGKWHRKLEDILAVYETVIESLAIQPKCLIHGEFFASNVLVDDSQTKVRVCPIDWETAGWGPAMMDLAALTAGNWNEVQREAMLRAYWEVLDQSPAAEWASIAALRTAYSCCCFHLAVRMLAQLPNWEPPPEHQQNWLQEAERLAKKLAD